MANRGTSQASMPSTVLVLLLLFFAMLIACVISPIVQIFLDRIFSTAYDMRFLLAQTTMMSLFIMCLIFSRSLRSGVRDSLNLPVYNVIIHFFIGVIVVVLMTAVASGFVRLTGARGVTFAGDAIFWKPVVGALALALIYEILFRGFVFQSLREELSSFPAIILSGALYVFLHFTWHHNAIVASPGGIDFLAGFKAFPSLFHQFSDMGDILPELAGYFLVSVMFCLALLKTGSLYVPVGMHAVLIFMNLSAMMKITGRSGHSTIYGVEGTPPDAFAGSVAGWILLLIAIIGFLSIGGIEKRKSRQ